MSPPANQRPPGTAGGGTLAIRGRVFTDFGVLEDGTVLIRDGLIEEVRQGSAPADHSVEFPNGYIAPGFVDLQINGGFGVDVVGHPGSLGELSAALPATGVTSYLPTVVTLPPERYPSLLKGLSLGPGAGARPLGLHLEGPFISPSKSGAHAAAGVAAPDARAFRELLSLARVSLATLAPELPGAHELLDVAAENGTVVSLGHSEATFDEARAALERGAQSVTHLFNAMSPLHHREPGLPGAAMSRPEARCGLIADGRHVHPEMVRLAFERLGPDRMYLVTDAMAAAGMDVGEYELAGRSVYMSEGVPRLPDGTLAGSVLTMQTAIANVLEFTDCTLPEAVRMASATPAALVGAAGKGRLAPGMDADVVALSAGLEVERVWVRGEPAYGEGAGGRVGGAAREPIVVGGNEARVELDRMSSGELLRSMNRGDREVAPAVEHALPQIEVVVRVARECLSAGGRLLYFGAGTSGRLALVDAVESSPTFGVEAGRITAVLAGGEGALAVDAEGAEDDADAGRREISGLETGPRDLVVGVSASGDTPFTLAAIEEARGRGARTACVVNREGSGMVRAADHAVEALTGPEILRGSTRLKAGTAQKLVLNMISTAAMTGLGAVYGDLMVGLSAHNDKLRARAELAVREITGRVAGESRSALERAGYDVRAAVLLLDGAGSPEEAKRLLDSTGGALRPARESLPVMDRR